MMRNFTMGQLVNLSLVGIGGYGVYCVFSDQERILRNLVIPHLPQFYSLAANFLIFGILVLLGLYRLYTEFKTETQETDGPGDRQKK